jgi:diguanylate cyclase (GGDEF)-like protein
VEPLGQSFPIVGVSSGKVEEARMTTDSSRAGGDDRTENLAGEALSEALSSTERYAALMVLKGSLAGQLFSLRKPETVVGRADDVDIVLKDRGVSRRHAKFLKNSQGTVTVVDLGSTNGVFVGGKRVTSWTLEEGDKVAIGGLVALRFSYQDALEEQLQTQLYRSATRDGLTGAVNKQHFMERLNQAMSSARRHSNEISVAMADIDHFKSVNDTYGHAAGDAVLREVAHRIQDHLRTEDLLGRFGGEEFVVLMDQTPLLGAGHVADRLREAVARKPFRVPGADGWTEIAVTVSVGVSTLRKDELDEALIMRADTALYEAKRNGRNQVALASELSAEIIRNPFEADEDPTITSE